jgi:uncharacterized protein YbjT (DUF2867 family)
MSTTKIAVAGATGRVGQHLVEVLAERGHEVVPISRRNGVDLITGEGLAGALDGVDIVIDTATGPSPDESEATEFFETATRNLHEAGQAAGVRQMVVVSIIGIDPATGGYSAAKLAHERAHLDGPIPARVLRAAQFHEFVGQLLEWGTQGDTAYVANWPSQMVAARTVAEALADLAVDPDAPAQTTAPHPEIAGPRQEVIADAARLLVARRGDAIEVVGGDSPYDPDNDLWAAGGLLPSPHATLAGPTYEDWLTTTK